MSRTITVEQYETKAQTESSVETQTLAWSEVMSALGFPVSWAEDLRTALAAKGKDIEWKKVDDAENY